MSKFIDITLPLSAAVPTFPGDPRFQMERVHRISAGQPYNVTRLDLGAHAGTHLDAPYHFIEDGATVDQLPLDILIGKARVVALPVSRDRVDRHDLEEWDLSSDLRLLIRTRNSPLLRQPEFHDDFVYLTPEAAEHLVQAGIKLVGIDYLSIEKFGSSDFAAHHILLKAGVVVVEGLDLSEVDPGEYDLTCLPLRLVGGDGSPVRAVLRKR